MVEILEQPYRLRSYNMNKKAYKNTSFLSSRSAREIRVLCEMTEPSLRLKSCNVEHLISFFGSARTKPEEPAYKDAYAMSYRLSKWCQSEAPTCAISTGGGPGVMEAANKGAFDAGGLSVGMGISLPSEQCTNDYISEDLDFVFQYFFTRKYWCVYLAKAFVVMPGGVGTMDELFEILTLRQTGKIKLNTPIVLFDTNFWVNTIKFPKMIEQGTISEADTKLFKITSSIDVAIDHITSNMPPLFELV